MLIEIPDVLTADEIAYCRTTLENSAWIDGRATAGDQAAQSKSNLHLPVDSEEAQTLGNLVLNALGRNSTFNSAALPLRVLPPMFSRYDIGMAFGAHVNNAIRSVPGTGGARMRADISTTLFLTAPNDYDGGELIVEDTYGAHRVKPAAGSMVVYPSSSLHRVSPITRGSRWASFFWTQSMIKDGRPAHHALRSRRIDHRNPPPAGGPQPGGPWPRQSLPQSAQALGRTVMAQGAEPCVTGMVEARLALGQMHLDRGDHAMALDMFRAAARSGEGAALNMLGCCHEHGWGTSSNAALAARHYHAAAERGDVWAMFNLADAYCRGNGVARNDAAAYALYVRAARNGHVKSLNMLGLFHEEGRTVTADAGKALEFYKAGAKAGDCWAQFNLARLLMDQNDTNCAAMAGPCDGIRFSGLLFQHRAPSAGSSVGGYRANGATCAGAGASDGRFVMIIPPDTVSLSDYERHFRTQVDPAAVAYVSGAAADGLTQRDNRAALDRLRLMPKSLVDMSYATASSVLFGEVLHHPIIIAPMAHQMLLHPKGEIETVEAASLTRTWMTVSTPASVSLEDVAVSATAPLWFQLYMQPSRDDTAVLVRRAEAAGYRAIVVTVDAPVNGIRNAEQRAGFRLPPHARPVNLRDMAPAAQVTATQGSPLFSELLRNAPTWPDIEFLCKLTNLPVLLKGILNPDDAERAVGAGARGIIVSNHGGRVLDTLPASIDALPGVIARVGGRVPVLIDGGVRRGTDIAKAIGLGAAAVLIGQPVLHALAIGGMMGVAHMLTVLQTEFEVAMALLGCPTVKSLDESIFWRD